MTEIDRLMVKLVGDAGQYSDVMEEAISYSEQAATAITQAEQASIDIIQSVAGQSRTAKEAMESLATSSTTVEELQGKLGVALGNSQLKLEKVRESLFKAHAELDKSAPGYDKAKEKIEEYIDAVEDMIQVNDNAGNKFQDIGSQLEGFGLRLTAIGGTITAVFTGTATKALMAAGAYEQTVIAFETLLQSRAKAESMLADITTFAAETPYEMPELQATARGLIQFGESQEQVIKTLEVLGNAASATSSDLGTIGLVYNQIRGAGKLLTQDFRQLSSRGVISLQDISTHFGIAIEDAQAYISSGKVSFEDFAGMMESLSSEGGRFFGSLSKQSQSLMGLWSTLTDEIGITTRLIGEYLVPTAKSFLNVGINIAAWFRESPPLVKTLTAVTLGLGIALGTVLTTIGASVTMIGTASIMWGTWSGVLWVNTQAVLANAAAYAKQGLAIMFSRTSLLAVAPAMAAAAVVMYGYMKSWEAVRGKIEETTKVHKEATDAMIEEVENNFKGDRKLFDEDQLSTEDIETRISTLRRVMGGITQENDKLTKSNKELTGEWAAMKRGVEDVSSGIQALFDGEGFETANHKIAKNSALIDSNVERYKALQEQVEKYNQLIAESEGTREASAEDTGKAEEKIKKLETELATLGMTNIEKEKYLMTQKFISSEIQETTTNLMEQIAAKKKDLKASEEAAKQAKRNADQVEKNIAKFKLDSAKLLKKDDPNKHHERMIQFKTQGLDESVKGFKEMIEWSKKLGVQEEKRAKAKIAKTEHEKNMKTAESLRKKFMTLDERHADTIKKDIAEIEKLRKAGILTDKKEIEELLEKAKRQFDKEKESRMQAETFDISQVGLEPVKELERLKETKPDDKLKPKEQNDGKMIVDAIWKLGDKLVEALSETSDTVIEVEEVQPA